TWKIDLGKLELPKKPYVFVLKDGVYDCQSCVPTYKVKADGTEQPVSDNPYADTVAVEVVDDHTIHETDKKDGRIISKSTFTVAKDGKTASYDFDYASDPNTAPVTGKAIDTRVEAGPAGSHAISGSWRTTRYENISDNGLIVTFRTQGDSLAMTTPAGQSFTAKTDGTEAPYKGDPGITTVSIKTQGKNVLEETDKRDGKPIAVTAMTVAPDGKSMKIVYRDLLRDTSTAYTAIKQCFDAARAVGRPRRKIRGGFTRRI